MPIKTTLAKVLWEKRLSQTKLSQQVGINRALVTMITQGRLLPDRRQAGKIAQALGHDASELFDAFWEGGRNNE